MYNPIRLEDLHPEGNPNAKWFRAALGRIGRDPLKLALAIYRWTEYNRGAGGLIAGFIQRLCFCSSLTEVNSLIGCQDRGCQIAVYPFRAIREEFGTVSHRSQAQTLLAAIVQKLGISFDEFNALTQLLHPPTLQGIHRFKEGYGFYHSGDYTLDLPVAYGHLLAGEYSAIAEFATFKVYLEQEWSALTEQLRRAKAFRWIDCHAGDEGVEVKHFLSALKGVNEFIGYLRRESGQGAEQTRAEILQGYANFYIHNGEFLANILTEE